MQPGPSASAVGSPRPAPMLARQRQEHILERVATTGGVRVADVVDELGISEMTVRRDITEAEGREELADQPYKLELITTKGAGAEGASVEVGAGGLTMYDNVRRDGSVAWTDLCRGPHLPSTRLIG